MSGVEAPLYERFIALLPAERKVGYCWEWQGFISASGYGRIHGADRAPQLAHRVAYELFRGPIPEGLHLDHLCRTRACVNPSHLEAVTQAVNNQRAVAVRDKKCAHPPVSVYVRPSGKRECRLCRNERRARQKGEAA